MDLRSDIHEALDVVTPPAPHLPHVVMDALREGVRPRRSARLLLVPATALAVLLGVVVTVVVVLPSLVPVGPATSPAIGSAPALSGDLAVTRWVRDPSVVAGPYPGYRPQLAPIDRSMVASAHAALSPTGSGWMVDGTLDARGRQTFAELTTAAAGSCPGINCPERHVTFWAGLTQDDVDHWGERAAALYQPVAAGGKLLTDPSIMSPITGGEFIIPGDLSQAQAQDVARWLNARG